MGPEATCRIHNIEENAGRNIIIGVE